MTWRVVRAQNVSVRWVVPFVGLWLGCGDGGRERGTASPGPGAAFETLAPLALASRGYALEGQRHGSLHWAPCADGFECATARLPLDPTHPGSGSVGVAVTRLPARDAARRVGPLFVNFGGPGGDAVASLHDFGKDLLGTLNERFDIVGFDPRGTGATEGAIDCQLDQENDGLYSSPYFTPLDLDESEWQEWAEHLVDACIRENGEEAFAHVSTANVARDMDALRALLGDEQLSYLGFSYGTFLGSTYAALFPDGYRAMVLDGAVDADQYLNRPSEGLRAQSAGFERALARFFAACAANQEACFGFGGADPHLAFDRLVAGAQAVPIQVPGNERLLEGDDILSASIIALYAKQNWSVLAEALAGAENGDPSLLRLLADYSYGILEDGTFDPGIDRYFGLTAAEQSYPSDPQFYLDSGYESWSMFDHYFFNTGYVELPYGLFPVRSSGVFAGPFVASPSAPTVLVVATTYDPATPYRGSEVLVESLGNARLLTMVGDGHTAYGGSSTCIDGAVEAYLEDLALPDSGAECAQEVPFELPPPLPEELPEEPQAELAAEGGSRSHASLPRSNGRWLPFGRSGR
jgi:pimeloyl-ACP methyl ester carboxylesterase